MYRLLCILFLTLSLCACSLAPPARPSLPENTLRASSPPPSSSLSPSPSPAPTLSPTLSPSLSVSPKYVPIPEPTSLNFSVDNITVLAQHEFEDYIVTQYYYDATVEDIFYEGTNIYATKDGSWYYGWALKFISEGRGQYDVFRGFVPDRERIYLLHGGAVSAREVATGKEIWNLELYGAPFEGVVDSKGNLYVTCAGAPLIVAISPEGEILWQYRDVLGHIEAWDFELVGNEIMVRGDDDYGEHLIYFDCDGNYRVEELRPSFFE